jgi:AsmA protein
MPRKIFLFGGLFVGLVLAGGLAFLLLMDANRFRPTIQDQLQEKLHRPVALGDIRLKLLPLSLQVADVVIGHPEGFVSQQPFLSVSKAQVSVGLLPLLRRQLSLRGIEMDSPQLELIRSSSGTWNYETGGGGPSGGAGLLDSVSLDELAITNGRVAITDLKSGSPRDVYEKINLTVQNLGPNRQGSLKGSVRFDSIAAALSVASDFHTGDPFTAKGTGTFKSDNNPQGLEIAYDISNASQLTIRSLTAKLGALSAAVTGSVDTQKSPPVLQLALKSTNAPIGDLIRVAALYGAKIPQGLKADGLLRADVQVTGTTEKPLFAGKIEASKAEITGKDLAEPVRSSSLQIDFTPDSLTTQPFVLETGGTQINAKATVTDYSSAAPKIDATLATNDARVEELLRIANAYGVKPAELNGSGSVNLDLKITGNSKAYRYSGTGALRDVNLTSPDLPKALSVQLANITFSDDRVAFDHLNAGLGSMHVDGRGSVRDFSSPKIQIDVHVDQIDVAELRQWGGAKQNQAVAKHPVTQQSAPGGFIKKVTASGPITIGKIDYDQFTLTNVQANVNLANGLLKLDPVTATVFGGQETGTITADLGAPAAAFSVNVKLTNVDSNQLLSSTTSLKNVLSGALGGSANLQFVSKQNEDIAKTLNGKIQVQMGQGRLAGVSILNEVANIGQFLGYTKSSQAFTNIVKLTGTLNIQNGLASTNDLLMDLGGGTLSAAGDMGLVDQSLKLKVTTVLGKDFAQKNIPGQIGGLLTTALANQQGELVVPMLVSGTFAQPRFAPDAQQVATMKLRGLLPTANNPGALTSGLKGIVDAFSGKQGDSKAGQGKQGDNLEDSILNLLNQIPKKKEEKKQ